MGVSCLLLLRAHVWKENCDECARCGTLRLWSRHKWNSVGSRCKACNCWASDLLLRAAQRGQAPVNRLVSGGASLAAVDKSGNSALHLGIKNAFETKRLDALRTLVSAGGNRGIRNAKGETLNQFAESIVGDVLSSILKDTWSDFALGLDRSAGRLAREVASFMTPDERKQAGDLKFELAKELMGDELKRAGFEFDRTKQEILNCLNSDSPVERKVTLICSGCKARYVVGENAVAVSLEYGLSLARSSVVVGALGSRQDLVASVQDQPDEARAAAIGRARESWRTIRQSLANGDRRNWTCKACDADNEYPSSARVS
jgi:hypothetical protein